MGVMRMKFFAPARCTSKGHHIAFCPKGCPGNIGVMKPKRPFVTEDKRPSADKRKPSHADLARAFEQAVRVASRAVAPPVPLAGPVKVTVNFYILQPKSRAKEPFPPFSKSDADTMHRVVYDALQAKCGGYLIEDDKQVVRWGEGGVWWADERGPGVHVEVEPLSAEQETLFGGRV